MEIEKNIPIPNPFSKKRLYPFDKMEVGDSFFVQSDNPKTIQKRLSVAINKYRRENITAKFSMRTVEGGVRCWRIA
jgi:hypothetical protein